MQSIVCGRHPHPQLGKTNALPTQIDQQG